MKRIEAIQMIGKILTFGIDGFPLDKKQKYKTISLSDIILSELEEAGMLPPPTNTDVVTSRLVYCYYPEVSADDTYQLDKMNSQLWEPEDE